jgi:hypothetical protein
MEGRGRNLIKGWIFLEGLKKTTKQILQDTDLRVDRPVCKRDFPNAETCFPQVCGL